MRGVARGVMRGAQMPRHILGLADLGYTAFGTDFDGSNDFMLRGADLTGLVDGKLGIISSWMRIDGGNGASQHIYGSQQGIVRFQRNSSNKFQLELKAGGPLLTVTSDPTYTSSASWLHLLWAWDMADRQTLYVNDSVVATTESITIVNANIDYTRPDHGVGAAINASSKLNMCLSELYINFAATFDISVEANRRKFISADLKPVDLGADGSQPSGTSPIMYFKNPFGTFQENAGTGGNFTVTGELTECSSSPSD